MVYLVWQPWEQSSLLCWEKQGVRRGFLFETHWCASSSTDFEEYSVWFSVYIASVRTQHTEQLVQEEKVNITSLQMEEKYVYTTLFLPLLSSIKRGSVLGPHFQCFCQIFFSLSVSTYKFHGWMTSALHLFLEHMPSGQNSQKGSLYSSELHTPENKQKTFLTPSSGLADLTWFCLWEVSRAGSHSCCQRKIWWLRLLPSLLPPQHAEITFNWWQGFHYLFVGCD